MTRWFPEVPVAMVGFLRGRAVLSLATSLRRGRVLVRRDQGGGDPGVHRGRGLVIFGGIELKSGAPAPMFSNLVGERLFPNGLSAVFAVMMTVVYAFQGCEIMGVAAGETERPEKSIPRAVRNVVFRVLIFYVLAIVVLSAIIPWQQAGLMESPFVQVFDMVGIPYAADLMNFVILTAILSVGNRACTPRRGSSGRCPGPAWPRAACRSSARGVPLYALLITLCFALLVADQRGRRRHPVHGADGGERDVRHRHLDRHRLRPIPLPPRVHGQRRHGLRAEICRAAVPAGAAGLHRRVLLAVRLPRPSIPPSGRPCTGASASSPPATWPITWFVAGSRRDWATRPGTGRLNGHSDDARRIRRAFSFCLVGLFEVVTAGSRGPSPLSADRMACGFAPAAGRYIHPNGWIVVLLNECLVLPESRDRHQPTIRTRAA